MVGRITDSIAVDVGQSGRAEKDDTGKVESGPGGAGVWHDAASGTSFSSSFPHPAAFSIDVVVGLADDVLDKRYRHREGVKRLAN